MNHAAALDRARPSRWEFPAVFAVAFGLLYVFLIDDGWIDQYTFLRFGQRVAEGQVPYRDFHMHLWPGYAWLAALWFSCVGMSMAGLHVLQALAGAAAAAAALGIARALDLRELRWAAPAGALAVLVAGNEGLIHPVFAVPCSLFALWAALHADGSEGRRAWALWLLAGACAAASGLFTQNIGTWTGFGLLSAAVSAPCERRWRGTAALCAGALLGLAPMLLWLTVQGLWPQFLDCTFVWLMERYRPFLGGVSWGRGLPGLEELRGRPLAEWLSFGPYVALMWLAVYGLPVAIAASAVRWWRTRGRAGGAGERRVLWMTAAMLYLVAWPLCGAHHIVRTVIPGLIVLAAEAGAWLPAAWKRRAGAALAAALLLVMPIQWLRRGEFATVQTERGPARMLRGAAVNLERIRAQIEPGSMALCLPINGTPAFLFGYRNPTAFEELQLVYNTSAHFERAMAQLEAAGWPPVVALGLELDPARERQRLQSTYGPSAFMDEVAESPLYRTLAAHYEVAWRDGGVAVLRTKAPAQAAGE
ncbi:MAG: hypothetical protein L6R28_19215 [Planctomycetes bacterium]|nr:hypothetical protein [Planctomycetota bacterium]